MLKINNNNKKKIIHLYVEEDLRYVRKIINYNFSKIYNNF